MANHLLIPWNLGCRWQKRYIRQTNACKRRKKETALCYNRSMIPLAPFCTSVNKIQVIGPFRPVFQPWIAGVHRLPEKMPYRDTSLFPSVITRVRRVLLWSAECHSFFLLFFHRNNLLSDPAESILIFLPIWGWPTLMTILNWPSWRRVKLTLSQR